MAAVLIEREDAVLRVTWNRPEALNALTSQMLSDASEAIEAADPGVRAIVLTGAGRAFSSGADLTAVNPGQALGTETIDCANRLIRAIRATPAPVIAVVNGLAAGAGCSIALATDLTVAAESAYFLLAFAGVGLMPDAGATAVIPAAAGRARATRMAMLGERIPARTAEEWGLITAAVPDAEFPDEAGQLVTRVASGPTQAFARTKHAFNRTALAGLETALEAEREGQVFLFGTDDFAEGTDAFLGKRKPRFTGK
ncbi:enoyl-CoA hydratase-related protein [Amycolatopsis methanolica]|uniref:enoyl-CoA hydratase-related protein n=1 Tax=Amycolatopsis methanolica TaxID=1814 RepID=UPI0034179186